MKKQFEINTIIFYIIYYDDSNVWLADIEIYFPGISQVQNFRCCIGDKIGLPSEFEMLCHKANIIKANHVAAAYLNKLDYKIFFLFALRSILNFLFDWRYICVTYLSEDYFIICKRHTDCVDCLINTSIILCTSRWTPVSLLYFHTNNEEGKKQIIHVHSFPLFCIFLVFSDMAAFN